jgi:hypothetical protein
MADETPVGVALELTQLIAWAEGKPLNKTGGNGNAPSREWILTTYAQCLETVKLPEAVNSHLKMTIPE